MAMGIMANNNLIYKACEPNKYEWTDIYLRSGTINNSGEEKITWYIQININDIPINCLPINLSDKQSEFLKIVLSRRGSVVPYKEFIKIFNSEAKTIELMIKTLKSKICEKVNYIVNKQFNIEFDLSQQLKSVQNVGYVFLEIPYDYLMEDGQLLKQIIK